MEHVEGEPLDAYCEARSLATEQRLILLRQRRSESLAAAV